MVVKTIRIQLSTCATTTDPITEVQYLGYSINRLLWTTVASFHVTNIDKCVHGVAGYYSGAFYGYGSQRPTYSNNYYQQQPSYNHNYHHQHHRPSSVAYQQQQPAYNYNYAAPSSSSYYGSNSNNYQSYQSYTNYQSYTSSNNQQQQYNYQQQQPSFGGYYGGGRMIRSFILFDLTTTYHQFTHLFVLSLQQDTATIWDGAKGRRIMARIKQRMAE